MKRNLKTLFLFSCFVLVFSFAGFSQRSDKTFLWKGESEVSKVYILGSIHLAKDDLYPLDSRIEDAFKESDVLVVEININSLDQTHVAQKFMEVGMYMNGDTFKNHVSKETYDLAKEKFKELRSDVEAFAFFKPWMLSVNLVTFELANLGFTPEKGIDQHFLNKANDNKEILDLETLEYQLGIFSDLTDAQQELFLVATLKDMDILEEEIDKMIKAWETGDTITLEGILHRSMREYPQMQPLFDKLFTKRNIEMTEKIGEFFKVNKTYFVVIGAGHLVGETGVIALLEEKGYKLEQL